MRDGPGSVTQHKISLARELLDDIELSRLPTESLLLKVGRLARLIQDEEVRAWIGFELSGFVDGDQTSLEFMGLTGRWTDQEKKLGYWEPRAVIEARIATSRLQLQQLRVPDVHFAPSSANPNEFITGWGGFNIQQAAAPIGQVLRQLNDLNQAVATYSGIRSRVLALLHGFASRAYYELAFSNLQESIFERQKALIDSRLATSCGAVLEKVPAVYDRLAAGETEAVSQALNTCRRILDAFADSIYPPRAETVMIDGSELKLTSQHHLNRINAFIQLHCVSESRRKHLRRALSDLYERVSAGVHQEVSPEEARFLFLRTYLLLGEILSLAETRESKTASSTGR